MTLGLDLLRADALLPDVRNAQGRPIKRISVYRFVTACAAFDFACLTAAGVLPLVVYVRPAGWDSYFATIVGALLVGIGTAQGHARFLHERTSAEHRELWVGLSVLSP